MTGRALQIALAAAVASTLVYFLLPFLPSEAGMPVYQRDTASARACKVAEAAITVLRAPSATEFVDDCRLPSVTPVSNQPGHVIVTRVVVVPAEKGRRRQAYSVLMDGQSSNAWRPLEARQAPSKVTIDASLLMPSLANAAAVGPH